jgi:uncharacterized protein
MLVALGFLVMLFAGDGLALAVTHANPRAVLNAPLGPVLVELQLIAYVPIVVYGLVAVPYIARRSLGELGLRPLRPAHVLAGILGAIGMFAAVSIVAAVQALFLGEHEQNVVRLFEQAHNGPTLIAFVVITVSVAPFVEEFVFRGFVFNALLRRIPFTAAAFVSGVLFAASHADPYALVPLTFGGAVLATVYYRTGSLVASMITHGLFNGTSLLLILLKDHLHV